jgi:hypothetical protein
MSQIKPIATTILGHEPAMGLYEIHEQSPGSRGFHRYQIIHVIRDGRIAEFRRDMGLASNFKGARQIRIPAYLEHTVDELMDLADQLRYDQAQDELDVRELLGISNIEVP